MILAVITVVITLAASSLLQSCSNNDELSLKKLSKTEMLAIASKHLINTDNIFSLDINNKQAIKLGISSENFDKMLNDVNKTNAEIEKIKKSNGLIFGLNVGK